MKTLRWCASFLFISCTFLAISPEAYAQSTCTPPTTRVWIIVQDAKGSIDTVWLGFDSSATRCDDPDLCDKDLPSPPPPGVHFFFPRFWSDCYTGGNVQDYRPFINSSQIDTFQLFFGLSLDSTFYPLTLRWSKQSIHQFCDSAIVSDIFGFFFKIDLTLTDSLRITNPFISQVDIRIYHARPLQISKEYYPLQTGNEWFYRETAFSSGESDTSSVQIIGDSLFSNGLRYYILDKPDIIGERFVRTDSGRIYYYNTFTEKDVQLFDFNANIGEITNNDWLGLFEYVTIVSIDTVDIFDRVSRVIKFKLDGLFMSEAIFSDIFGPIKVEDYVDGGPWPQLVKNLIGCSINEEIFGYTTSIKDEDGIPTAVHLEQNYPNPFNPETHFEFRIAKREFVSLKVFNMLGEEIATVVSEPLLPGIYTRSWEAPYIASGVYYYRLSAGSFTETRKMLLMK